MCDMITACLYTQYILGICKDMYAISKNIVGTSMCCRRLLAVHTIICRNIVGTSPRSRRPLAAHTIIFKNIVGTSPRCRRPLAHTIICKNIVGSSPRSRSPLAAHTIFCKNIVGTSPRSRRPLAAQLEHASYVLGPCRCSWPGFGALLPHCVLHTHVCRGSWHQKHHSGRSSSSSSSSNCTTTSSIKCLQNHCTFGRLGPFVAQTFMSTM